MNTQPYHNTSRIPIVKIRWSHDRLVYIMKIQGHGKECLYIKTGPQIMALPLIGETS